MAMDELRKAIQAAKKSGSTKDEIIKIVEEEFKRLPLSSGADTLAGNESAPEKKPPSSAPGALSGEPFKPIK